MKGGADREGSSRFRFRSIFENLDLNLPAAIRWRITALGVCFLALIRFEKTKTGTGRKGSHPLIFQRQGRPFPVLSRSQFQEDREQHDKGQAGDEQAGRHGLQPHRARKRFNAAG